MTVPSFINPADFEDAPRSSGVPSFIDPSELEAPDGVGIGEAAADAALQFGQGFNQTMDTLLFGPARLATEVGEAVSSVLPEPVQKAAKVGATIALPQVHAAASEANPLSRFLRRDTEAKSTVGRLAKGAGRAVAVDAPLIAATMGLGPGVRAATEGAKTLGGQVLNRLTSSASQAPARVTAAEVAAASGSGAGQQVAKDAGGGKVSQSVGALTGAMVPGIVAAASPLTLTGIGSRFVRSRVSPDAIAEKSTQKAGRAIQSALENSSPAATREAEEIQRLVPDINLTIGERSQNPALLKLQGDLAERAPQTVAAAEAARRQSNETAVRGAMGEQLRGEQHRFPPETIARELSERSNAEDARLAEGLRQADDEVQDTLSAAARPANRQADGERLRELTEEARAATQARMSQIAEANGLNDAESAIPFADARDRILGAYRGASEFRTTRNVGSPEPTPEIARIMDSADAQPFPGLMEVRSRLAAEQRALSRAPTPENAAQRRGVTAALTELDDIINTADQFATSPGRAQAYREFRDIYRREFADRFRRGAGQRVLKRDSLNQFATKDEQVAAAFFGPGKETEVRDFARIFTDPNLEEGVSREAAGILRNAVADAAHRAALDNQGRLSVNRLQGWLNKNEPVINLAYDQQNPFGDAVGLARQIEQRRAGLADRQTAWNRNILRKELQDIGVTGNTPEEFLGKLVSNPALRRQFLSQMGRERGQETIRATLWGMLRETDDPVAVFRSNRDGFRELMGGSAFRTANLLINALERTRQVGPPTGSAGEAFRMVDQVERSLNMGLNQLSSRVFAVQSGRTSSRFITTEIASRVLRGYSQRQADRVLSEALLDPELGRRLAQTILKPSDPVRFKRLYTYLLSIPLLPQEEAQEE